MPGPRDDTYIWFPIYSHCTYILHAHCYNTNQLQFCEQPRWSPSAYSRLTLGARARGYLTASPQDTCALRCQGHEALDSPSPDPGYQARNLRLLC